MRKDKKYYIMPDWYVGYKFSIYKRRWLLKDKEIAGLLTLKEAKIALKICIESGNKK